MIFLYVLIFFCIFIFLFNLLFGSFGYGVEGIVVFELFDLGFVEGVLEFNFVGFVIFGVDDYSDGFVDSEFSVYNVNLEILC